MDSSGGLLSLKWNNHSSTFFHVLETIRKKELYSDVTIACDGKFFSVHKLVLSTCSEYFQEMFERTQCKHPIIVLKDINHKDLESLLNYMYIGEVNVIQTELSSLIKAAECLKVKGLAVPDEPPTSSRKSSKRPNTSDREEGSSHSHKKNRRTSSMNSHQHRDHGEDHSRLSADPEGRSHSEKESRLKDPEQSFREFETIHVKSEKPETPPPDNFVPEEIPPVNKFEFDGSPGIDDSAMSSGLDEASETYAAHISQQQSEDSMSHLIPSTSGYGEASNWPSDMDALIDPTKVDKEGVGGEAGAYDPSQPFPFESPGQQGKSQMGFYTSGPVLANPASENLMKREDAMWKCLYRNCTYMDYYKNNVAMHVRKHTGEKPFVCPLCGFRACRRSQIKTHIEGRHRVDNHDTSRDPCNTVADCIRLLQ